MKKNISLHSDFIALISVTLALTVALVAQSPRQAIAAEAKCQVCHNDKNPHTVTIPCNQVKKYLHDHPGDYAGACQGVTDEKPPKK